MIPTHLVFKWFPIWTRDRVRWWGETAVVALTAGFCLIWYEARPTYVMPINKPGFFYQRKLDRMLKKGQISEETYNKHVMGIPYYNVPDYYTPKNS